jgi:two-component system cell cycle response regulator DivK
MNAENYKALIVDDNERNLKLFKLIVESLGFQTVLASDGEEGIAKARQERPHLILMDIRMPVIDGIAAFEALRSEEGTRDIPVIALTSYAMKGDRERFLEKGFADYISKPIDVDGFKKAVLAAIRNAGGNL